MRIVHPGRLFVLCGVVFALLAAVPAMAAVNAYMTVKGAKQGPIKGEGMSENIRLVSVVRDTPSERDVHRQTDALHHHHCQRGRCGVAQVRHGAEYK